MSIKHTVTRVTAAGALAGLLGLGTAQGAAASGPHAPHRASATVAGTGWATTARADDRARTGDDDGWHGDGLSLNAADNNKVDAFLARARRAERSISPQVRTAALLSRAELVGFESRLKSPDSLKRKVATSMKQTPGQTVDQALSRMNDAVRYTLQWPERRYTAGAVIASTVLSGWGNDSVKWSNTWGRTAGYKGLNSAWRAPRSGQTFEIQFHTPAGKRAQEITHKLYEERRLPSTTPERARELQEQQDAVFAAVPVPYGAERLTAPAPRHPAGAAYAPVP